MINGKLSHQNTPGQYSSRLQSQGKENKETMRNSYKPNIMEI